MGGHSTRMLLARLRPSSMAAVLLAAACDVGPGATLGSEEPGPSPADAGGSRGGGAAADAGFLDAGASDAGLETGRDAATPDARDPDPAEWCARSPSWPRPAPAVPPFELNGPPLGPADRQPDLPTPTVEAALVEPPDLGFGGVTIGQTASVTIELVAAESGAYAVASPPACPTAGPFCARFAPRALEVGDRFVFDVVYRPRAPASRDRAIIEVTSAGAPTRTIPVDGTALDGPAINCWAPARLSPIAPGDAVTFEVRCANAGRGAALLTDVTVESGVEFARLSSAPLPRPTSPLRLGARDAAWLYQLRPPADAGAFEATVRWRGASTGGAPGAGSQTIRGEVVPGRLELASSLVVPAGSHAAAAWVELHNPGLGPVDIHRVEVDGPFEIADTPDVLFGGERVALRVSVAPTEAILGDTRSGELRLFAEPGGPQAVSLRMDPPRPGTCQLDVPGYTDLGRLQPPAPEGAPDAQLLELLLGVKNVGDGPCLVDVEASGLIENVTPLPSERDEPPTPTASIVVFAGEASFLRLSPRLGLPPGKHVGRVELVPRGDPNRRSIVRFGAELTSVGARVRSQIPFTCPIDRHEVVVAGVRVPSARWLGADDDAVAVRDALAERGDRFMVERRDGRLDFVRGMLQVQTSNGLVRVPMSFGQPPEATRTQVERFEVFGRRAVDLLIVMDDSASMARWHPNLARNLMDFVNFIDAQQADYRLLLARTATGGLAPLGPGGRPYITPDDAPERRGAFVEQAVGRPEAPRAAGSGFEQPIETALRAVAAAREDALRKDARLSVFVITDEADGSIGSIDSAVDALLAVKAVRNPRLLSLSAISGGEVGCRAGDAVAAPAPRLDELAHRTGGVSVPLCISNWSQSLEELWPTTMGFGFGRSYRLSNKPAPGSIEVWADGVRIPETCPSGRLNWSFDFVTNSVLFTPLSSPPPGTQLRIAYDVACY